jgi:hypothetical protein
VILDSLAEGATRDEVLASYPSLRVDHINAALAYAAELAHEERLVPIRAIWGSSLTRTSPLNWSRIFATWATMPTRSPTRDFAVRQTPAVVDAASAADRILFTLDKRIANLQRYPIHQHAGVVLFRLDTSGRGAVIAFVRERLHKVLEMHLAGRLTVVGPPGIRFR